MHFVRIFEISGSGLVNHDQKQPGSFLEKEYRANLKIRIELATPQTFTPVKTAARSKGLQTLAVVRLLLRERSLSLPGILFAEETH
jgi:hypothetical protein